MEKRYENFTAELRVIETLIREKTVFFIKRNTQLMLVGNPRIRVPKWKQSHFGYNA